MKLGMHQGEAKEMNLVLHILNLWSQQLVVLLTIWYALF